MAVRGRFGWVRFRRLTQAEGNAAKIKGSGDSQIPGDRRQHLKRQRQRKKENVKPTAAHKSAQDVTDVL